MTDIAQFTLSEQVTIPESAMQMAATLLLDTLGVAAGAATLNAGRIGRDVAVELYGAPVGGPDAPILFDGRRVSLAGAAFAAATQIDNLDGHDGYNPTKGHIGCAVVPALFAYAQTRPDLTGRDALTALVIAYEVAARAGIALHATVTDYHTSGAWNALGVAALGCRLLGATPDMLRHALGIAEYHGPRSQMMREIDNPTMLHDGSGIGALMGVSAAMMAMRGFHGAPALTVEAPEVAPIWADLGQDWTIEKNYIKPYPICRWAHAAIDAVQALMTDNKIAAADIAHVEINTFAEAARLYKGMPDTTSQAQYSLPFAIATMLLHGRVGPEHVSGVALQDDAIAEFLSRITIAEAAQHSRRFPVGRWSDAVIQLRDGRHFASGDVHARGGPEAPMRAADVRTKFRDMTTPLGDTVRADQIWDTGQGLLADGAKFASLAQLVSAPPQSHVS